MINRTCDVQESGDEEQKDMAKREKHEEGRRHI